MVIQFFSPVAMCHRITDDFSDLFIAAASSSGLEMSPECVNSVNICSKVGSSDRIKISNINMQLNVAVELDKKMVEYTINSARLPSTSSNSNAFTVLMNKSKVYIMPKKYEVNTSSKVKKLSGPQHLYCDLIDWAQSTGCGWPSNIVEDSGKQALKSLSNALWYVDHCHARLKDASCHVPTELNKFQNYNSYKLLRHRPPIVKAARLGELVGDLYSALSLPSLSDKRNTVLAKIMGELAESLKQYKDRLENDNQKHQNISHKRETANCGDSNSVCIDPVTPSNVKEEYSHLNQTVVKTSDYTYVHLDKFCPDNRIERRKFIKNLRLSKPIMLYRVAYGGSIGTLNFIWSVPVGQTEDKTSRNMKVISQISEDLPTFSSRAMRQEFIDKFISYVKCPKSVVRHMYFSLTGHEESANSSSEKEINERVSKIIGADDSQLLIDLRATNGSDTYYDAFFEEMGKFFEEQVLQVSERRKCDEMYLPLAISIETLKNDICKRVPDGTPIPSNETIRLQFCPSNPFHKTALRYTGQFNVKFRVQTRQARVSHPDSHYAAKYFQYMKEFCVMFRDSAMFLCMDDKAIVPVGEPGIPISTGVRGHNKVLTPSEGPVLVATDHDFHLCGLVPSVVLVTEIPRDSKDSFFSGDMHVTTKEKVFSPSSPFRHAAQVIELVRLNDAYSADGLNLRTPIMCLYTDGGPDHRVTYETVKLSLTLIFMHLDLDMLIALRTAPSHSWTNPAERCMSILNLALQHVALDRNEMEEKYEQMVKNLSSLTAVRNQARLKDGLKEAFKKSMEPVVHLVNKRFSQMSLKGNPVKTLKGVSDEEITSILDITGVGFGVDSPVATADTKSAELKKSKHLQDFFERHAESSHYCFQLKKCSSDECGYCSVNPVRDQDVFDRLRFLPEPKPDENGEHYLPFSELFGKALTRDKYRPSTRPCGTYDEELQNHDKENREILRNEKLRDAVLCGECSRPRCVFSPNKLDRQQEEFLRNIKACHLYICGDQLEDAPDLYVRRCVTCSSEVETAYFSAKCRHYLPPVCIHCGSPDCLLDDNDAYIADLYTKYSIVRPICVSCRHSGKEAKTWGAKKFKKKQKVK